jgi:hypothetical protein
MFDDSTDTDYQAYFADAASATQSVLAAARQRVVCALARDCSRHWFELLLFQLLHHQHKLLHLRM